MGSWVMALSGMILLYDSDSTLMNACLDWGMKRLRKFFSSIMKLKPVMLWCAF